MARFFALKDSIPFVRRCAFTVLTPLLLAMFQIAALSAAEQDRPHQSALWGQRGELWTPVSRLPDFSFAGYHRGEAPIPNVSTGTSVVAFGADGSDDIDDTDAFKRALEQTDRGAIEIPAGRYIISDILEVRKPNLVLRGAGPDKTSLYFPKPLEEIRPNPGDTSDGRPTSNYSWSGGFIWVRDVQASQPIGAVTMPATRGDASIVVSSTDAIHVGDDVQLRQSDDRDNSLATYLYAGDPGDISNLHGNANVVHTARVTAIDGKRVTLDRPLKWDVDLRWTPRLLAFEPAISEVGIENIRFEFPITPYEGHFTEVGWNAIAIEGAHCWVRNVVIDHCDSGIFVSGRFCTLTDIVFNSKRSTDRLGATGHHGVTLSGEDNLLTRFRFNQKFIHDVTFTSYGSGNVVSDGSGIDLALDNHRRGPYANLYTNIDLGLGTRPYRSGGGKGLGKNAAAWTTYWNIRSQAEMSWPLESFAPQRINLVGVPSDDPPIKDRDGKWFEPRIGQTVEPANLHEAQLARRLGQARANEEEAAAGGGRITP